MLSAVSSVATASPLHRTLIGSGERKEAPDLREAPIPASRDESRLVKTKYSNGRCVI